MTGPDRVTTIETAGKGIIGHQYVTEEGQGHVMLTGMAGKENGHQFVTDEGQGHVRMTVLYTVTTNTEMNITENGQGIESSGQEAEKIKRERKTKRTRIEKRINMRIGTESMMMKREKERKSTKIMKMTEGKRKEITTTTGHAQDQMTVGR